MEVVAKTFVSMQNYKTQPLLFGYIAVSGETSTVEFSKETKF